MDNYSKFHSMVIEMDDLNYSQASRRYFHKSLTNAIKYGFWITLLFKEKICTLEDLILTGVMPRCILDPKQLKFEMLTPKNMHNINREYYEEFQKTEKVDMKSANFRLIIVFQRLELSKQILDKCVLVSVDEEKIERESNKIMLQIFNRPNPKLAEHLQQRLDFIEACFEGDYDKVKSMLDGKDFTADTHDLNGNTALMEAALKGWYKI